ncbi:fibronectin type III domain-containing protein [Candidatus Bathyarchaeota archaeon]|nr:fibronectin type III domain-containing protein [Candidatus Bathyarchaeota archaeon]
MVSKTYAMTLLVLTILLFVSSLLTTTVNVNAETHSTTPIPPARALDSAQVSATMASLTAVTVSMSESTENSLKVTWTQSADPYFASYQLFQSTTQGQLGTLIGTITNVATLSQTVTGLSPGTTYYFTVRAIDAEGVYADSTQRSGTTATPLWQLHARAIGLVVVIIIGVIVVALKRRK